MNIEQVLETATRGIGKNYFQLPIDGRETPIYRERVYCYELYHQLRVNWPKETEYELSGEVDKAGHPLIRGNDLDNTKPDLLVHIPGDMSGNHTIIEVKPITASRDGIKKDLFTLTAFHRNAGYRKAIYLLYGSGSIGAILETILELGFSDEGSRIDLTCIEVWWHSSVGNGAERLK